MACGPDKQEGKEVALSIVIIVLALAGSAFISASEAGLIAVNRLRIRRLAAEGNRRAASGRGHPR